jgi:hypothetical protein
VSEPWIGFVFTTEAERAKQARFAGKLARRWGGVDPLAVVGLLQLHGKPGAIGSLYDAAGHVVRSAVVTLDGADGLKLRSLARFLDDGLAGDGVSVVHDAALNVGPPREDGWRSRLVPQLLVGAGAAAVVAGGVLYAIDQDPGAATPREYRNAASAGVAVGTFGIAAVSMGLWLWSAHGNRRSTPTVAIGHAGGFIGWAGAL